MTKPLVLIFGDDETEMRAFGGTVKDRHTLGFRFPSQLSAHHIENVQAVYMMKDYPAVRAAYGEKAVLADAKTGAKTEPKTGAK